MSSDAMITIGTNLVEIFELTRTDQKMHTWAYELPMPWAYAVFIAATQPAGKPSQLPRLEQYVRAKKYQRQADRCHGILLDERGVLVESICLTAEHVPDSELDRLVVGLRPSNSVKKSRAKSNAKNRKR